MLSRLCFTLFALFISALLAGCNNTTDTTSPAGHNNVSQNTSTNVPQYSAEQFFATKTYFGNDINHDNSAILVASDETGVFNLYRVSMDGKNWQPLTQSTTDPAFPVSWFPNDDRLLYTADQGGNELNHVYLREVDGTVRDLTPGDKLKAYFAGWHNDGSFYIATNERDPRFFDLYHYNSKDYSRKRVYQNDDGYSISNVSKDGRYLALSKERNNADNNLFLVDLGSATPKPVLITEHQGNISHQIYGFTPDSKALLFGADGKSEFVAAYSYNLQSGATSAYSTADWDISFIYFSDDKRYRVQGINADASTVISITDLKNDKALQLPDLPAGDLRGVSFSDDSKYMSFYLNADNSPSNLYVWQLGSPQAKRLTQALDSSINEQHLVQSQVVRFNSFDDVTIPALLYKPHQADPNAKVPALVWIHGGPGGQSRTGYNPMIQHLVNHGYAVLSVNNRGSSGYGKTFYHLDDLRHGEDDLQDIVYGKKYLQNLDWVAGERIGVIGGSYGGYLTMAAMAFTDEFEAGINIFGVTNWVRTLESIPPWWESFRESLYAELGDPAVDGERLRRISPVFHGDKVQKPVLVVQGANDPRVLQVESDEMVEAIRANDVPVEYVLFDDEGHGFLKKSNRIKAQQAYLAFLKQYL
ncbi:MULTISPECIES: S9 family peptidase [unclassified Arsukibacterium]|uniref:S9 family peptidase n=1 Tax=unclassified Arsukibacterium TaxID=2635278 RepID=UPI000C5C4D74|nr:MULTISPECIES: alpha/beta fold hydrolase [unclassified Arsukibacterium]MAA94536.1 S9 family peptidase [Rheinheimera sp.]MBM32882.1 S9 family peptidase [Rheinheimera sp.]HAW94553.1 S9 family peptidase [Candidatus Azambacteria bacterium]|tara:strand:- start:62072 stop:64000 length:1929 start_codon:yes stop_codon:yes gene_type:complete